MPNDREAVEGALPLRRRFKYPQSLTDQQQFGLTD